MQRGAATGARCGCEADGRAGDVHGTNVPRGITGGKVPVRGAPLGSGPAAPQLVLTMAAVRRGPPRRVPYVVCRVVQGILCDAMRSRTVSHGQGLHIYTQ